MNRPLRGAGLLVALTMLLAAQGSLVEAGQRSTEPEDIRRFRKVAEGFYRGGQPEVGELEVLKQLGVKTVVNLRSENKEKESVEALGMKSVHIPLNAWDRVPQEAINRFFSILQDPSSYPVFVHCRRGADRTGVMVGFYRIAFQGWDGKEAYREARYLGMRWWYRGLKNQLQEFAEKRKTGLRLLPAASSSKP